MVNILIKNPTAEQVAIAERIQAAKQKEKVGSFAVDAKAGSGKTTTTVACVDVMPQRSAMVAFNKSIADELERRLNGRFPASTFHSLGLRQLRERLPKVRPDSHKIARICKDDLKYGYGYHPYADVIEHMLTNGVGIEDLKEIFDKDLIVKAVGYSEAILPKNMEMDQFVDRVQHVMNIMFDDQQRISFPEMLWLPLRLQKENKWHMQEYSYLFIDEAQDVSPIRWMLAKAVSKYRVPIGDPFQSIYGFAGAMTGAFQKMIEDDQMDVLTLSTSWRCSKAVIAEAQRLIGTCIFASPDAKEGAVRTLHADMVLDMIHDWERENQESHVICCRTNSPLFKVAMRWIKQGKPFELRNDMADRLLKLVKKLADGAKTKIGFEQNLLEWKEDQEEQFADVKGILNRIKEQFECIMTVLQNSEDIPDVILNFEYIINSKSGPILSTIHKTKGLEFDHVYLLRPDLLPAPWVDEADEESMQQEKNLEYVAVTRAKDTFTRLYE